jgi:exosortase
MADNKETRQDRLALFRSDLLEFWRSMPDKPFFFGLFAVWVALFHFLGNSVFGYVDTPSLFQWSYYVYDTSPDDEHGKLIPWVVLGLFWWKRRELMDLPKRTWWPAIGLIAIALLLHVGGYLVQQSRLSIVAFVLGLYGLMGLAWGPAWLRASFFPMILFVFCIPLATLSEAITFPLRMLVTKVSVAIAQVGLGIPVIRKGTQIFDPQGMFGYEVAEACSGIRSLITLMALTMIYGFVNFQTFWKRALIIAAAVPLAVAGNVARITTVIIAGEAFGQKAGMFVEQKLGFLTFAVAIGSILVIGYLLRERPVEPALPIQPKTA